MKIFFKKITFLLLLVAFSSAAFAVSASKKSSEYKVYTQYTRAASGHSEDEIDPTEILRIAPLDSEGPFDPGTIVRIAMQYNKEIDKQQKELDTKETCWFDSFSIKVIDWFKDLFGL